jgi:enterochelin esterase family protein
LFVAALVGFAMAGLLPPALIEAATPAAKVSATVFKSHEVHADRSVTFRFRDPTSSQVQVRLENQKTLLTMTQTDGLWSVTTPPLAPSTYWYSFVIDGRDQMDPFNRISIPNYAYYDSALTVPGSPTPPWEATAISHGTVTHHFYTSNLVENLPGGQSDYYVYTPPSYDPAAEAYPVLVLLHGYSQSAADWTALGGANFILDRLIAEGKAKPMVVVMPLGYGDMTLTRVPIEGLDGKALYAKLDRNEALFSQVLLTEILPRVEVDYHIARDRDHRAIAGLSMGGLQSLDISLNHPDTFAWVGAFSPASYLASSRPLPLDARAADLKLLWLGCGIDDELFASEQKLAGVLDAKHFPLMAVASPGGHSWVNWHEYLVDFAARLFK